MQCKTCGSVLKDHTAFCPNCGTATSCRTSSSEHSLLYQLAETKNRRYRICVNRKEILFSGIFWYLKDKEFVKCSAKRELADPNNFLGMGYLAKRSFKKTLFFVLAGSILEIVKCVIDKLTEWVDTANQYLQWIDRSVSLPEWVNPSMNFIAAVCILIGIALFFSKKKVIEISFTDKRICVPEKSMSQQEYHLLYQSIIAAKGF